jgi:CheY-like chemotaxis protein
MFWIQQSVDELDEPYRLDGGFLATSSIRVLVVDDFEPYRRFICSTLQNKLELRTIIEASDGWEAIELAKALQPDLIVLDIGLPKINGIEAARKICGLAPRSRILFVSQESSVEVVQAAFSAGALGYVVKVDAESELPSAVKAVLRCERFAGSRFAGHGFTGASHSPLPGSVPDHKIGAPLRPPDIGIGCRHEAGFYSDDASLLDGFTQFVGAALKAGNAAIVLATESHRDSLLPRLQAHGLDIGAAIEQGRYISLDAADSLATFMINDQPDPVRFLKFAGELLTAAAKAAKGEPPRVAACGEGAPLLWAQGNAEAAIRVEQLWNEIAKTYDVDILCGYSLGSFYREKGSRIFRRICAEHAAVDSW